MLWQEKDQALYCKIVFKDFKSCFEAMTKIAAMAEEDGHHPKWTNVYNVLEIWLSTHDAGNIVTEKDRALAKKVESYFETLEKFDG